MARGVEVNPKTGERMRAVIQELPDGKGGVTKSRVLIPIPKDNRRKDVESAYTSDKYTVGAHRKNAKKKLKQYAKRGQVALDTKNLKNQKHLKEMVAHERKRLKRLEGRADEETY